MPARNNALCPWQPHVGSSNRHTILCLSFNLTCCRNKVRVKSMHGVNSQSYHWNLEQPTLKPSTNACMCVRVCLSTHMFHPHSHKILFPAANNTSLGLDTSTSSGMLTSCWDITLHHNTTWDESLTNAAGAVLYTMKMQLKHFYSNSFHFISCCVIPCHFMSRNYKNAQMKAKIPVKQ